MSAAVLLPARLVLVVAERRFLALADGRDPARGDAEAYQVFLHCGRAARPKTQVVLRAAARVAMAFERDLRGRPALHPVGVLLQRTAGVAPDRRLIEIEENVVERVLGIELIERLARENLLFGERRRRGCRRRWWRWRRRRWRRGRCGRRCRRRRGRRGRRFLVAPCGGDHHGRGKRERREEAANARHLDSWCVAAYKVDR